MSTSTQGGETCAVVLALCLTWLERFAPAATVHTEVDDEVWRDIVLVDAARVAVAEFRAEQGGQEEL